MRTKFWKLFWHSKNMILYWEKNSKKLTWKEMFFECQKTFQNLFPITFNLYGNVNRATCPSYKRQPTSYWFNLQAKNTSQPICKQATSDTIQATRYKFLRTTSFPVWHFQPGHLKIFWKLLAQTKVSTKLFSKTNSLVLPWNKDYLAHPPLFWGK